MNSWTAQIYLIVVLLLTSAGLMVWAEASPRDNTPLGLSPFTTTELKPLKVIARTNDCEPTTYRTKRRIEYEPIIKDFVYPKRAKPEIFHYGVPLDIPAIKNRSNKQKELFPVDDRIRV